MIQLLQQMQRVKQSKENRRKKGEISGGVTDRNVFLLPGAFTNTKVVHRKPSEVDGMHIK